MFDAVIRPACRTKPLPAAGDLPFGAVACGIPSCGSPPHPGIACGTAAQGDIQQPPQGRGQKMQQHIAAAFPQAQGKLLFQYLAKYPVIVGHMLTSSYADSLDPLTCQDDVGQPTFFRQPNKGTPWSVTPDRPQADMGQKRSAPRTCAAPAQEVPKNSTGLPISRKLTNEPLQSVLPVHSTSSAQSRTTS